MVQWNGLSLLWYSTNLTTFHYSIQTDASGSWGCGAVFQGQWLQLKWDRHRASMGMMAKELVPIVLATAVWGPGLQKALYCSSVIILVLYLPCVRGQQKKQL